MAAVRVTRPAAAPRRLTGGIGRKKAHDAQKEVAGRPDPQFLLSRRLLRIFAAKHPLTFVAHLCQSHPDPILGFTP